jgi:phage-related protein
MGWVVEFYRDSKGREPVVDFIDSLPVDAQAKALRLIDLLARYGVLLKEPYTKQIKGKLRELRIIDKVGKVRILYFTYTGKRFILLHGFVKKSGKTPLADIDVAERRMNDFSARHGGKQL